MAALLRKAKSTIFPCPSGPEINNGGVTENNGPTHTHGLACGNGGETSSNPARAVDSPPPVPPKDSINATLQRRGSSGFWNSLRTKARGRADLKHALKFHENYAETVQQSPASLLNQQYSVNYLRHRLVHKSSTLSLRKRLRTPGKKIAAENQQFLVDESLRELATLQPASTLFASRSVGTSLVNIDDGRDHSAAEPQKETSSLSGHSQITTVLADNSSVDNFRRFQDSSHPSPQPAYNHHLYSTQRLSLSDDLQRPSHNYQRNLLPQSTWAKMAAPSVDPPLAYNTLMEIASEVCDP